MNLHATSPQTGHPTTYGFRLGLVVVLVAVGATSVVLAGGDDPAPDGGEFRMGTGDPGTFADYPSVCVDPSGNFVVVWEEFNVPGTPDQSRLSIQAQRWSVDGDPIGAQFQANSTAEDDQRFPGVAVAPSGNFLVVWHSDDGDSDPDLGNIYAQRFGSNGQPVGDEIPVNSYTTGDQVDPSVAVDENGDFVVVWGSDGSPGSDDYDDSIQGRRVSATGVLGPQFQVNSYTTRGQLEADIAAAPDGTFVVVWRSFRSPGTDSSSQSILARRLDSSASPVGSDFQVNSYTTSTQAVPAVAFEPDGDFLVVWESFGTPNQDTNDRWEINSRLFDSNAAPKGTDFQINQAYVEDQRKPDVAGDPKGEFMVTWQSEGSYGSGGDESSWSVHFRRVNTDGGFASGQTQVNTFTPNAQEEPAVGFGPGCKILLVWSSQGTPASNTEVAILGQLLGSSIFCDDFEGGDSSRWSSVLGLAP
jgi:hypothetical protein